MTHTTLQLTPEIYRYLLETSLREQLVLQSLREKTHSMNMGHMQIAPEQGQFLSFLMELMGAKKTLDIGTFTGYSALWVALALPNDGKVIACDINEEWGQVAQQFWQQAGVENKIELILAPAIETLENLIAKGESGTFDFALIDADKMNYRRYYELCLQLVRVGGVIAIDNVLWYGKVADPAVTDPRTCLIRKLNQFISEDQRVSSCMLPIGDGLTLIKKRHL